MCGFVHHCCSNIGLACNQDNGNVCWQVEQLIEHHQSIPIEKKHGRHPIFCPSIPGQWATAEGVAGVVPAHKAGAAGDAHGALAALSAVGVHVGANQRAALQRTTKTRKLRAKSHNTLLITNETLITRVLTLFLSITNCGAQRMQLDSFASQPPSAQLGSTSAQVLRRVGSCGSAGL